MDLQKTDIEGVYVLTPKVFQDDRGWLMECYSERSLVELGINFRCVQENHICSVKKGVLRGIHFQNYPYSQAKLIRCTVGSVMDYAIDLRKDSPTYKHFVSVELSGENKKLFFLPQGFGHAVISLTDYSEIEYKVDNLYEKDFDRNISYLDKELNIPWCLNDIIVSEKDKNAPFLADSDCNY